MKWPRKRLPELDEVIKVEDIDKHIIDAIDTAPSRKLLSVVSPSSVLRMGENLAALHDPRPTDWAARFGLPVTVRAAAYPLTDHDIDGHDPQLRNAPRPSKPSPIAAGRTCESCSGLITAAEVYFSTVKLRSRYGGKAICRACQDRDRADRSA